MPDLLYKPDRHEYWLGNQQLPGITLVLSQLGYNGKGGAFYTDESRQKGQGVHLACPIADRMAPGIHDLDAVLDGCFEELHPQIHPYLAGWLLFKKEKRYVPCGWETPLVSRLLRTCCTPDNWGQREGLRGPVWLVCDMKSWKKAGTKPTRASQLQTAIQELVLKENGLIPQKAAVERYVVKLRGNGKYYAHLCDNPLDTEALIHAVKTWHDLRTYGLVSLSGDPDEDGAAIEG